MAVTATRVSGGRLSFSAASAHSASSPSTSAAEAARSANHTGVILPRAAKLHPTATRLRPGSATLPWRHRPDVHGLDEPPALSGVLSWARLADLSLPTASSDLGGRPDFGS